MIKTYCDLCGKEIETSNDEVNMDFNAFGCTNFRLRAYQFHADCARRIKDKLEDFFEEDRKI